MHVKITTSPTIRIACSSQFINMRKLDHHAILQWIKRQPAMNLLLSGCHPNTVWTICGCMWSGGIVNRVIFCTDRLRHGTITTPVSSVIHWRWVTCHFLQFLSVSVKYLLENERYRFQVFSLSSSDYQAGSNEIDVLVPAYRRARIIAIGVAIAFILMLAFASVYIYWKKRCFEPYPDADEKPARL